MCNYLEHVFIISFWGSTRHENVNNLKQSFSNSIIFPAIKEYDVAIHHSEFYKMYKYSSHPLITNWEYSLALTHRNIYDLILLNNYSCALIFESDAHLHPKFHEVMNQIKIPENFDILKVEHCEKKFRNSTLIKLKHQHRPCTAGYLISRTGANKLRFLNDPIWMNADGIMDNKHVESACRAKQSEIIKINMYLVTPSIVIQTGYRHNS